MDADRDGQFHVVGHYAHAVHTRPASALEGYTIVQVSDLNGARFGDNQEKLVKSITSINYDALCMTGDMIGASGDAQPLYELVDGLNAQKSKPMLFITGDADPDPIESASGDDGNVYADYINQLIARGVTYLDGPYGRKRRCESVVHIGAAPERKHQRLSGRGTAALPERNVSGRRGYRADGGIPAGLRTEAQHCGTVDAVHRRAHRAQPYAPVGRLHARCCNMPRAICRRSHRTARAAISIFRLIDVALCGHCGRTMACACSSGRRCLCRTSRLPARRLVPGSESGQGSAPLQFGLHIHDIGSGHFVGVPPAQFPTAQHARDSRDKADRQAGRIGGKNCQSTFYKIITARTKICCKM